MIIEILQLINMIVQHQIHILILFFGLFVLIPCLAVRWRARKYKPYVSKAETAPKVTVIIPVHTEDPRLFTENLDSIAEQKPDQLIVAIDSQDQKLKDIAKAHGAELIEYPERVGKRLALADAWLKARNDIVVQVDSDVVIGRGLLSEIVKPFEDSKVYGVAARHQALKGASNAAYIMSKTIEASVNMNNKSLNGGLIVVDGRANAWRKSHLLKVRDAFLNERWLGSKSDIGDDRFLSREVLKAGGKTVTQDTAVVYVPSPNSFSAFLHQQLRWRRSGTKFYIKDVQEGVMPSALYALKTSTYYTAPFIFALAVILDTLYFPLNLHLFPLWSLPLTITVGCTLVTALRQTIYFNKLIYARWVWLQALVGLFILLPIAAYGGITAYRQGTWGTRGYDKLSNRSKVAGALVIVLFAIAAAVAWTYTITQDVFAY